jgi:hypothetical protein
VVQSTGATGTNPTRFLQTFALPTLSRGGYDNMTVMREAIAASILAAGRFDDKKRQPE